MTQTQTETQSRPKPPMPDLSKCETVTRRKRATKYRPARADTITYERTPASVDDLDQSQRWFQECGEYVVSVTRVRVWIKSDFEKPVGQSEQDRWPSTCGYEVTFECGATGFVCCYNDHAELTALVDADRKGYLAGVYCGRKYGKRRGNNVCWLYGKRSKRAFQPVDRLPSSCCLELYRRAAGQQWPPQH